MLTSAVQCVVTFFDIELNIAFMDNFIIFLSSLP